MQRIPCIASMSLIAALATAGLAADVEVILDSDDGISAFTVQDVNSNELARIQSDGRVGIGTAGPGTLLNVSGSTTTIVVVAGAPFGGLAVGNTANPADQRYFLIRGAGGSLIISPVNDALDNFSSSLVINRSGNVGINDASPSHKLDVNGTARVSGNAQFSSRVGVGTASPTQDLDVNGNARFRNISSTAYSAPVNQKSDGTLTSATSDARLKKDIEPIENALGKVLALRGVTFHWRDEDEPGRRIGMIAQEVEDVLPEAVFTNPNDGYKGVLYGETVSVLIEAMKEQQAEIARLRQRIETLEQQR